MRPGVMPFGKGPMNSACSWCGAANARSACGPCSTRKTTLSRNRCGLWMRNAGGFLDGIGKEIRMKSTNSRAVLKKLGLKKVNPGAFCGEWLGSGKVLESISPIDGQALASVRTATPEEYQRTVQSAQAAFQKWQTVPAPKRGELIRQLGNALREAKPELGRLVTLEAGKI